jgi:uncharacterized protein (DUF433 family)
MVRAGFPKVELIGRNSNLGHVCKEWADLRRRISESPRRAAFSGTPPRSKRFLVPTDIDDIVHRYEAGETIEQIGAHYGISKTRVAFVLREQGVAIRRQGLTDARLTEAAELYAAGRSLAWLGARYGISHTAVAAALRHQGVRLRPRPGWR